MKQLIRKTEIKESLILNSPNTSNLVLQSFQEILLIVGTGAWAQLDFRQVQESLGLNVLVQAWGGYLPRGGNHTQMDLLNEESLSHQLLEYRMELSLIGGLCEILKVSIRLTWDMITPNFQMHSQPLKNGKLDYCSGFNFKFKIYYLARVWWTTWSYTRKP